MDRHNSTHPTNIGNTNRRFKIANYNPANSNYQPSTTYQINFSLPASENIIKRKFLPGLKNNKEPDPTIKNSSNSSSNSLNKYKLLEKELDKRKKDQINSPSSSPSTIKSSSSNKSQTHSQSYSNIFSNKSPQFANRDKNSQLAKPTLIRSNATINYEQQQQTNSLNDLYKVENLFDGLDRKEEVKSKDDKSKSIEFIRLDNKLIVNNNNISNNNNKLDKSCNTSFDTSLDDKLNNNYIEINDKLDKSIINHHHKSSKKEEIKKSIKIKEKEEEEESNNNNNNNNLKPKIILTEPSIDLTDYSSNIDKDYQLSTNNKITNRLNVYSTNKKEENSQESKKEEEEENNKFTKFRNWFSWFKIILTNNNSDKDSNKLEFKVMIYNLIKKWYRELFLTIILLICVFNAIRTSNLATRKTKLPIKFFPSNSLINEYEFGDIQELSQLAFQNEITFVMYYAPWDAESIEFKNEYLKISKYYKDQIFFAAVNCWYPDGECSKSYRIKKYPVFIAHVRNIGEVEYKGPSVASYMIPFLDNLLNPVKQILNEGDLLDLKSKHDGVVVGYFDFNKSTNPTGYKYFLQASIRSLYQDPWRNIQFAIISSKKSALKFEIDQPESVLLYTWNNTYSFKSKLKKVDNLLKWIYNTLLNEDTPLVQWITPTALKSDTLSVKLLAEPTLILFTPRSLILNISPYYDILREVAMDYYNCDNSPQIKSLIHRIILRRRLKEEKLFELEEKCHEIQQSNSNVEEYKKLNLPQDFTRDDICCHHQLLNFRPIGRSIDKKCYCTACVNINKNICPSSCKKFNCLATASRYLSSFDPVQFNSSINYCNEIKSTYKPKYTPYYDIQMSCSGLSTNEKNNEDDYQLRSLPEKESINSFEKLSSTNNKKKTEFVDESMERMIKNFEEHHCKRLSYGLNYNDFNFPDSMESGSQSSQKWRQNFTGLGCKTNKTLGFIAIDSLMYQSFLEGLGIDAFNETHTTVIMIIEAQEENIYVLNHRLIKKQNEVTTINKKMIYEFIKDYNENKLRRYLRSPLDKKISSSDSCLNKTDENGRSIICVPEVTTSTFNEIVLDDKKDVLLLFYTQWCGFCQSIASTFLIVARFFAGINGIVFARINADLNDLPIEYSVDRLPSLILFPAGKKMESVLYPINMPITTTSLLQFVLANVQDKVKWQSSFQLCNKQCLKRNFLAHHLESKELSLEKLRLINRIEELKSSLANNLKNKNLKKILNDFLLVYGRMIRGKENKYQLFNNLKEILSNRILNFNEELTHDLNNELINDMVNLLNSPTPSKIQEDAKKPRKETNKSKDKKSKNKKLIKKDEL